MSNGTNIARHPAGWGVSPISGHPTFTVHGPSWGAELPELDGFYPHFIARHGVTYTIWTYRPRELA